MKNIDGVDLDNLVPNEDDDLLQVAPMIRENIIEVRYVPVKLQVIT